SSSVPVLPYGGGAGKASANEQAKSLPPSTPEPAHGNDRDDKLGCFHPRSSVAFYRKHAAAGA
ncbi:MAG TPA: hypothetical protein VGP10_03570, partial [Marisediminicola sp.]|nr:hypothetical protein [Marisediminicola sp.]